MTDVLSDNVAALKQAFTVNGGCAIGGFDLDCEEDVDQSTIVALSQIFFEQGFEVSFCPYTNQGFWQGCMQTLWDKGLKVSRWNLQCYSGGAGNDVPSWIASIASVVGQQRTSYMVPRLAVVGQQDAQCPTGQNQYLQQFCGLEQPRPARRLPVAVHISILGNPGGCNGTATLASYVAAINNRPANDRLADGNGRRVLDILAVMPGLDPGIHQVELIFLMDCRVKPGNDECAIGLDTACDAIF